MLILNLRVFVRVIQFLTKYKSAVAVNGDAVDAEGEEDEDVDADNVANNIDGMDLDREGPRLKYKDQMVCLYTR